MQASYAISSRVERYQVAFKNYHQTLTSVSSALPTPSSLQHFVIALRERGVRPVTIPVSPSST